MLTNLTEQLSRGQNLDEAQVAEAVRNLTNEQLDIQEKANFLSALAQKGETVAEIAGFARELRERAVTPPIEGEIRSQGILDVVGAGGDHSGTFNISTTAALIVASAGVYIAKHGNRAITSKTGSADVLEALGIPLEGTPEEAARRLRTCGFVFLFAPRYHPSFKGIGPARKLCAERGQRTIFNILGPLLNPARPDAVLVGMPKPEFCEPVAGVLQSLGVRRGMVVCGESVPGSSPLSWMDELSLTGSTCIAEFYQERALNTSSVQPEDFGLTRASLQDLAGGDAQANARCVERILRDEEKGPKRQAALFNAAAALWVAGKADSICEGLTLSESLITSGKAATKLEAIRQTR